MKASAKKPIETSNASNELSLHSTITANGSQAFHATSTPAVDLESKTREAAFECFIGDVKDRFEKRFPGFPYDSPQWEFRKPSGQTDTKGQRLTWQQVHQTKVQISNPYLVEAKLTPLHPSFARAARAILAHRVLLNKAKNTYRVEYGLSALSQLPSSTEHGAPLKSLHALTAHDLKHIERCVLTACLTPDTAKSLEKEKLRVDHLIAPGVTMLGRDAFNNRICLLSLNEAIGVLQKAKVISPMHARLSHEVSDLLKAIQKQQGEAFRKGKAQELEPCIAALSDAITAMADGDPRLSQIQEAVLCVMGLEMCAPSRINEVLTMTINDRLRAVDAYDQEPGEDGDSAAISEAQLLYRAHAEIKEASVPNAMDAMPNTVLMKGSKGAKWGAKPLLDFMLVMFNWCFDHLIEMGARSRMLLQHYEKHPNMLYLPPDLEHLRGKPLNRVQIGRIMLLDGDLGADKETFKVKLKAAQGSGQFVQRALGNAGLMFTLAERPDLADQIVDERTGFMERLPSESPTSSNSGTKADARKIPKLSKTYTNTRYAEWSDIENELLRRVRETMDSLRWVTSGTQQKGRLSNMLMLFDHLGRNPAYLPGALSFQDVKSRLMSTKSREQKKCQTVFEAIDLKMPILSEDGTKVEIVPAYCRSHDPRRWLTTMALRHSGPELSRLLINLWANRLDVTQLKAYDYLRPEEKAAMTAQAVPEGMHPALVNEHDDLNLMLKDELIGAYKLKTQSIGVGLHAVRVTTMDAIHSAEMNHPVAKAGGKVILIFPTPYGMCLHQHFERGCTNYRGCGSGCSSQRLVKGHLPTNENSRKHAIQLHNVIVAQVRRLILARNRRVVHDLDKLDEHLGTMIRQHMEAEEIASRLIADFLEIKDLIKDAAFKADLEDAFAFKGMVERLDNPEVTSGAVIRYDNPERHGSPEIERTIEALGGRKALDQEVKTFLEGRDYMRLENRAANETEFGVSEGINEDDSDEEEQHG
ncbi:MAG: hypothetical protein KJ614_18605 [Gammaproteobacteria bacterium]|uniref:hypothetical protein n=1 Tax=Rhodoferax sp. TaxID=50421 RepID=UPI0017CC3751|nr:hypothetical protein [Rhodoferax sp.]MBU3900896.1 hypothetical protein [Gammaproteobacteria bacterium]MBA3057497.1 hypothetical protein [Rhodoferax sp.]MBU3998320.1 hypothetical protein [Gammaproteobacteria bacterium]MBU4017555.1 hypothetical protein [Gammaproteobacteria bacterium]MBU4078725.1 hypothetical protein [Gammaproteobacteria bacterium]